MTAPQRQRAASAVGGKTARACDGCAFRRARWYCAADDAFLCQGCDASVHSANPLARRHERVRLKTSLAADDEETPAWHQGFKRKARTPRPHQCKVPRPVVPDLDTSGEETGEEEQLLYRVPILEPMLAEFCSPLPLDEPTTERKPAVKLSQASTTQGMTDEDFAADVESLLGAPLHDDSFCMEGLMDLSEGHTKSYLEETGIKEEQLDQETAAGNGAIDAEEVKMFSDMLDIDVDEEKVATAAGVGVEAERVMLRLDYEAIIAAWSSNGSSPWTGGERPQLDPDECWPEYMEMWGGGYAAWGACGGVGQGWAGDGDREARVTRYREKRRTRLFSKKIRYEVRKLNAEKRPRLKGRFVKRASFAAAMAISYESYGAS